MEFYDVALFFFIYSFLGWCTEVAFAGFKEHRFVNRGFLNGPFCPIYGFGVASVIVFLTPVQDNWILLYVLSVILVTVLEGLTGWAMDKIFHNKWWDYSNMPLNIGGYVCLLFSLIWGVACVFIMEVIHPFIAKGVDWLPRPLGWVLIGVFSILLIADTVVTASSIFKFHKKLEHMERIAKELHELSDQLGENIYSTTAHVLESAEDFHERHQDTADELQAKAQDVVEELYERRQDAEENMRAHLAELKKRYHDLNENTGRNTKRLLRAFPKLESRQHQERISEIREQLKKKK